MKLFYPKRVSRDSTRITEFQLQGIVASIGGQIGLREKQIVRNGHVEVVENGTRLIY